MIVCRGLQGFAAASFGPVSISYVVDFFPKEKRVTAIGFISSSFLISAVFGQVISSYIRAIELAKCVLRFCDFLSGYCHLRLLFIAETITSTGKN